jgi:hypothetical protein
MAITSHAPPGDRFEKDRNCTLSFVQHKGCFTPAHTRTESKIHGYTCTPNASRYTDRRGICTVEH